MPAKKFLDSAGLSTFLNNLQTAYAANESPLYATDFAVAIAGKANQLATPRTIALTGAVAGSASFDGSENISITTTADLGDTNVIENVGWKQSGADSITWLTPATVGTGENAKEKAVVLDLSTYALKSEIAAALNFRGSLSGNQIYALTVSDVENGDVYFCTADNTSGGNVVFHQDYEYVAVVNGSTLSWTELGKFVDLSGYATIAALNDYVPTSTTVNNKALSGDITLAGSDIALTGYSEAAASSAVAATDTVNQAIGKVEKKADENATAIESLQNSATSYAFAEGSTNGAFQVTPTVGGVAGTAQSVAIHGLGSAAYADTTDFVPASLTPAETGAQVNDIEVINFKGNGDSSAAPLTITNKAVTIDVSGYALSSQIPSAATAIADNDSGYATGDQVYDYIETHKSEWGDENVIESVKFKGNGDASASALVVDNSDKSVTIDVSSYALTADLPAQATAIADNDTGYATGDQVYDYIEALPIPDATINSLFGISGS